jgi:FAD binding domain
MGAVALFSESKPVGRSSFLDDGADDRTPYPFALVLEQIKTERVLIGGLEEAGGWVEWETELVSLTSTPDGVRASVRRRIVPRSLSRPGRSSARTRRAVL